MLDIKAAVRDRRRETPTDPLRVALFSGNYNYVRDGANQTLNRLVAYLESQGIPVRIYSPTVPDAAFAAAGEVVSVPSVPIPRRREYRIGLGLPREQRKDLEAFAPTLLHVSAPDLIGGAALEFARRNRLPVVASYHTRFETYLRYYGLGFLEPVLTQQLRGFYRRCDQLLVPTEHLRQALRDQSFNEDIRIWSRGIDRARFSPEKRDPAWRAALGADDGTCVIAFVGRLVLEKGLRLLAEVAERLAQRGVKHRIVIVGAGPERERLQQRMPNAVFTGHLDGEALARAYASADVFFNPSVTETFGNVTLEAMASAIPVVCVRATGSQSLVTDGVNGILHDATDTAAFDDTFTRLAQDIAVRSRLGAAGRALSAKYDWTPILAGVVTNYLAALWRHQRKTQQDALRAGSDVDAFAI